MIALVKKLTLLQDSLVDEQHFLQSFNTFYKECESITNLAIFNKKKISFFVWFMILITEYTFIKLWAVSSMVSLTIFIIGIIYAPFVRRLLFVAYP